MVLVQEDRRDAAGGSRNGSGQRPRPRLRGGDETAGAGKGESPPQMGSSITDWRALSHDGSAD